MQGINLVQLVPEELGFRQPLHKFLLAVYDKTAWNFHTPQMVNKVCNQFRLMIELTEGLEVELKNQLKIAVNEAAVKIIERLES